MFRRLISYISVLGLFCMGGYAQVEEEEIIEFGEDQIEYEANEVEAEEPEAFDFGDEEEEEFIEEVEEEEENRRAPKGSDVLTQGEAAKLLVYHLGLDRNATAPVSEAAAARMLTENGVSPFKEWALGQILTIADFSKMLVEAMGKADEIAEADQDSPRAYVDYLQSEGVNIGDGFSEVVQTLETLKEPIDPNIDAGKVATDPLLNRPVEGLPDETVTGTDSSFELAIPLVEPGRRVADPLQAPVTRNAASSAVSSSGGSSSSSTAKRNPVTPN